jgi:hypothetical protein
MKTTQKTQQLLEAISVKLGLDPATCPTWAGMTEGFVPIYWDWPGWLSPGFLTVLAGQPGIGKSTLCLHLATSYSIGRPWPDTTSFTATPGKTLWVESEGGHRANLARLQSWGLDPAQIVTPFFNFHHPQRNFNLAGKENITDLLASASRDDVRFIVLDSLSGLLSGATSPRRLHDLLDSLARIARFVNKPMLITHNLDQPTIVNVNGHSHGNGHDNGHGRLNLNHLLSSPVIAQLPRLIWALDLPDPADPGHRRLSVIKNNLTLSPDPLGLRIDDHGLHFGPPYQI